MLGRMDQKTPNTDTFQVVSASILSVISKYLKVYDQIDNYKEYIIKVLTVFVKKYLIRFCENDKISISISN